MSGGEQTSAGLTPLLEEALELCVSLREYSRENLRMFTDSGDEEILRALERRDTLLSGLSGVEGRADALLEAAGLSDFPPEAAQPLARVRELLAEVTALDLQSMELLRVRMQQYKDSTLKAQNRRHISAYLQSGLDPAPGSHYNRSR